MIRVLNDNIPDLCIIAGGLALYLGLVWRERRAMTARVCRACKGTGRVTDPLLRIVRCEACGGDGVSK